MVDVDKNLVEICQKHLPMMHKNSFSHPKLKELVFADGIVLKSEQKNVKLQGLSDMKCIIVMHMESSIDVIW